MSTYLVTGGLGFIGSHLVEALLGQGDAVRVLDDLSSGHLANLPPGAEFLRGDVLDGAAVRRAAAGADGLFHLAAIASVERGVRDPVGTHRVNLTGMLTVAEVAAAAGLPLVYASSAAAYGDAGPLPLEETALPRPLSTYGADKLGCELHARALGVSHGLRSAGLRFFNVFGPRQDPRSPYSGVISIFLDRALRGEAPTVFGDGGQTRDFVHVSDVVAALRAAMRIAATGAPVLNVCTGRATSVLELAGIVAKLAGASPGIRHAPARAGEIRHSLGSPARAAALAGIRARVGMVEGLGGTLRWMRDAYRDAQPTTPAMPNHSASEATRMTSAATGQARRPLPVARDGSAASPARAAPGPAVAAASADAFSGSGR